MNPTVSVIIPTRHRPEQLKAAVQSALAQDMGTGDSLEVIVVQDGSDQPTEFALRAIDDRRLRVIVLSAKRGHASARNAGIARASGAWCAFLDDDDRWLPSKLSIQLDTARRLVREGVEYPVLGCVMYVKAGGAAMQWPTRFPKSSENIGDYLYARAGWRSVFSGYTIMQTSMLMVPTELAQRVPFRGGMRRHADPDWLMRLQSTDGVRFVIPDTLEPQAIWNLGGDGRVSASGDWRYSLVWVRRHAQQMSTRAIAGFLSGPASHIASQVRSRSERRRAFGVLFQEMLEAGDPCVWDLAAMAIKYARIHHWRQKSPRMIRRGSVL